MDSDLRRTRGEVRTKIEATVSEACINLARVQH
jgi:hypothetical protein